MPVKVYDGTNWVTVAGDGAQGAAGANATSSSISTWVKTASGGETSLSGTGDSGYGTLAYTVGQELVYLNGVLLDRGDDYTATNGTSITGLTALAANDVVTVWTVNSFSVANTYTIAQADAAFAPISVTGGMTLLSTTTLSGASTVINSISQSYKDLQIIISGVTFNANHTVMRIAPNGSTNISDYVLARNIAGTGTSVVGSSGGYIDTYSAIQYNNSVNSFALTIYNYTDTTYSKSFRWGGYFTNSDPVKFAFTSSGGMDTSSAISSLTFSTNNSNTYSSGQVKIYGVK